MIKMAAVGLVYRHYGKQIITTIHPQLASGTAALVWLLIP